MYYSEYYFVNNQIIPAIILDCLKKLKRPEYKKHTQTAAVGNSVENIYFLLNLSSSLK